MAEQDEEDAPRLSVKDMRSRFESLSRTEQKSKTDSAGRKQLDIPQQTLGVSRARSRFETLPRTRSSLDTVQAAKEKRFSWSTEGRGTSHASEWHRKSSTARPRLSEGGEFDTSILEPDGEQELNIPSGLRRTQSMRPTSGATVGTEKNLRTKPPSKVEGLTAEIISPKYQRINWNPASSASSYKVITGGGGKPITTNKLSAVIRTEDHHAAVIAVNDDGDGPESDRIILETGLFRLKEAFIDKLKYRYGEEKYIRPKFEDVTSGEHDAEFLTDEFRFGNEETLILMGASFTGKTSCCYHFITSLPEEKVGVYLDWNDYRNESQIYTVETMFGAAAGLGDHDVKSALEWMNRHSDQIVFVLDNVGPTGWHKTNDDHNTARNIIRDLIARRMFPNSKVFCTTSQESPPQVASPCRILKVIGFQNAQIDEMSRNHQATVPEHLKFLCVNPGYCKVIMSLIRTPEGRSVDIESTASVLTELLVESLGKDKSNLLEGKMDDIKRKLATHPRGLPIAAASTSSTVIENSESLEEVIMKSLYLGLICPLSEYMEVIEKDIENIMGLGYKAKVWVATTGLLRESTALVANNLFEPISLKVNLSDVAGKRSFTKKLIETNFDRIRTAIQYSAQTTLDWLDVISEIDLTKVVAQGGLKIAVKKTQTWGEVRNVAMFLRNVRKDFHSFVTVEVEKGVRFAWLERIETSAAENPFGQIPVQLESDSDTWSTVSVPVYYTKDSKGRKGRTGGPPVPVRQLTAEIISPSQQRIKWESVRDAHFYSVNIFDGEKLISTKQTSANSIDVRTEDPKSQYHVSVKAVDATGSGPESKKITLKTDLLQLKQAFVSKLKSTCENQEFVRPNFKHFRSGEPAADFLKGNLRIGCGETVILVGGNFTGKTSCCYSFIKSLSEEKLGIYLDCNDYKHLSEEYDVETILIRSAGLQNQNVKVPLEWMKIHSDQIVFIVDNVRLVQDPIGRQITHGYKDMPQRIIRSLIFGERKIFPSSVAFCTTPSKDRLQDFTRAYQVVEITGFQETQMTEMGRKKNISIPEHLKFLCINPGFCSVITSLLTVHDATVDTESAASVLVKLLLKSLGKGKSDLLRSKMADAEHKFRSQKQDFLKTLKKKITPKAKVKSTSPAEESSDSLDDIIMKSLYLGLFCPPKEYKELLKKNIDKSMSLGDSAKMWVLSTGLLREDTATVAKIIFECVNWKVDFETIAEKRRLIENHIKDKFDSICKKTQLRFQTTLAWLDVIMEIHYDTVVQEKGLKIVLGKSHGKDQVQNLKEFLGKVRKQFHPFVKIEVAKGVDDKVKKEIEESAALNFNGQISVDVARHPDTWSVVSLPVLKSSQPLTSRKNVDFRRSQELIRSDSRRSLASIDEDSVLVGTGNDERSLVSTPSTLGADGKSMSRASGDDYSSLHSGMGVKYIKSSPLKTDDKSLKSSLLSDDYQSLHASSIGEKSATKLSTTSAMTETSLSVAESVSLPYSPWPVEIIEKKEYREGFPENFVEISKIFTIKQPETEASTEVCYSSAPIYGVYGISECLLYQLTSKNWDVVKNVSIDTFKQIALFSVKAGGIYVLAQEKKSALRSRYLLVCRTKIVGGNLLINISKDDGSSTIVTSDVGTTEQKLIAKINDQFNVKVATRRIVMSDWNFSLHSKFEDEEKLIPIDWREMKSTDVVVCSIFHDGQVVSQATVYNCTEKLETSLTVEFTGKKVGPGDLKFIAMSLSGGKTLTNSSSKSITTFEGIDPGDQYMVKLVNICGQQSTLIAESVFQTAKTIHGDGGTVKVGNCILEFSKGAIIGSTAIAIACFDIKLPSLPKNSPLLAPILDFRSSSQQRFMERVKCKVTLPYIVLDKSIEVDVIYFEENKWEYACTTRLSETKEVEFTCDHFTPYGIVYRVPMLYSLLRNLPVAWEVVSHVYYDKAFNLALAICLNCRAVIEKCRRKLDEQGYKRTPHLISKIALRSEVEAVRYKLIGPLEVVLGGWEITLNREFSRDWMKIEGCCMEPPQDPTKVKVKVERSTNPAFPPDAWECYLPFDNETHNHETTFNIIRSDVQINQ